MNYNEIIQDAYLSLPDVRNVDISIIIPVHGRTQFNNVVTNHFKKAISYIEEKRDLKISLTFVEHSYNQEHYDLIDKTWVNYIYIPMFGQDKFNKCMCFNIGALYSNEAKFYLFHDVDVIVPMDFFEKLMENIQGNDCIQSFTKKRLLYANEHLSYQLINGIETIDNCIIYKESKDGLKIGNEGAAGGSIFIRKQLFIDIGGYDTFFTEYSVEDAFFLEKVNTISHCNSSDKPPIELIHLWHDISFNQTTKPEDFSYLHSFQQKGLQDKKIILNYHKINLIKYMKKKPKVGISDTQFIHSNGGSLGTGDLNILPTYFDWSFNNFTDSNIHVFTESCFGLVDMINVPIKILLILEPECINGEFYRMIQNPINYNKFSFILTHNEELIKTNPDKFKFYFFGGCWIREYQRMIYPKSKNISIIASSKTMSIGHKLRHEVIANFKSKIEGIYGRGYNSIGEKIVALKDYRYSIIIENEVSNNWITEKLIDCFITGTIPIYWGCKNVGSFFNANGMILVSNLDEIKNAIEKVATIEFYNSKSQEIIDNFELAKKYCLPEDNLWNNYFKKYYE